MPQQSPYQIEIPACNVLDYVFPKDSLPFEKPIWIDAADTSNSISPKQLLAWIKRLGAGLDKCGVPPKQAIMMFSRNHVFVPVLYLGLIGSGRVFTACNPTYGVDEFAYQLEDTGASVVLVEPMFLDVVLAAANKIDFPRERVFLFSDYPCKSSHGIKDWGSILSTEEESRSWQWPKMSAEQSSSTVAILNYSSGTTGRPKGVMLSHQNIVANVEQSLFMRGLEQHHPSNFSPPERWLGFLPLYHVFGQLWSITAAAVSKTPVYMMRSFSFEDFLHNIQYHRITHIQTAPPVLVMLAKRPETQRYDMSSLANILCGAAPLSKELQNEVSTKYGVTIVQTWGMTELTCSGIHVPGGRDDRSGAAGLIDPNSEVRLIDEAGKEVGPGERGELCYRGPNCCLGYHRNKQATNATISADGFLSSGDIATRDEDGWFWIVDRKKELIKVNGFQVAPAELEALLLEHKDIADAAVVGVPVYHNERPRAYVVLKDHAKSVMSETGIQEWVAKRVAKHKRLTGGIKFIDEIPKSPSGKIQRAIIRNWVKEGLANKSIKAKF